MGKFSDTLSLMSDSWKVVNQAREILVLQAISFLSSLIVAMIFILPLIDNGMSSLAPPGESAEVSEQVTYYLELYFILLCNYFVIIFFNVAIVHCSIQRLKGGRFVSVSDGLSAAVKQLPAILGWTFISATIGIILRIIEDRSETVGQIVAGLVGMAWNMSIFFVIPVMIVKNKGPIEAVSDSARLIRTTWAEQLLSNISYGLVYFVFSLVGIALILLGYFSAPGVGRTLLIGSGILYSIGLAVVFTALESVFKSALYLSAQNKRREVDFKSDLLDSYKPS